VYTAGDAYAPKHWPKSFVHYADSYGRHKVLFGTDWPVIDPERAVGEIAALGFRPESHAALMRENALRIFTKMPRRPSNVRTPRPRR
jgi:predicted TIM-barrel fold metal-dependent hydrolase